MGKLNCWEFKECGREPGGCQAEASGVCRTTTAKGLNGIHDGQNAGRCCWALAIKGFCAANCEAPLGERLKICVACPFHKRVRREEGKNFLCVRDLLEVHGPL